MEKLKITNIPRWISEIHLKHYFNGCGKIVHASVMIDPQTMQHLGYGYLVFADDLATRKALEKNGALLDGSRIEVVVATEEEVPSL